MYPLLNQEPRHEDVLGEWRYSSTQSWPKELDGGEWSVSHTGRFTPGVRTVGTHWTGGWVGPRAGLDDVAKEKSHYYTCRESNPGRPARSLACIMIELPQFHCNIILPSFFSVSSNRKLFQLIFCEDFKYEGHLKSSWIGGSAPLLCRGRRWLLWQVVVVGVT
jgi:hypothetical protein